jgi:predicted Zn-dependent protease
MTDYNENLRRPASSITGLRVLAAGGLLLLPVLTGCGGSGGGGDAGAAAASVFSSLGSGFGSGSGSSASSGSGPTLGSLVGGKTGQYVDAGGKAFSALAMSDADEDDLGRSIAIAATNQWPLYDNPALTKYVTMVGLTLADRTSNPSANWVFGVLDTPDLAAYSGPNGYIMITRGAIAAMQDESELAGVLAHEMSHVLNHDGLEAVKKAKYSEAGLQGLSATQQHTAILGQASDLLVNKMFKGSWDQGQETNADAGAVKLLQAAGYDATGLARFLQRLGGGSAKPFGTHPGTQERVGRITSQAGAAGGATNAGRFAKAKAEARL